jgi:hypothetical protein
MDEMDKVDSMDTTDEQTGAPQSAGGGGDELSSKMSDSSPQPEKAPIVAAPTASATPSASP